MDFDGEVIIGDGHRHNEWPIHGEILKRRPDLNFTGHTHAFYSVIFSSISEAAALDQWGAWLDAVPL